MAPKPITEEYAPGKAFDLWLPAVPASKPCALVVFYHGGGLVSKLGDKTQIQQADRVWQIDHCLKKGLAFMSASYALFPHNGFDMIADVQALFEFIARDERFDSRKVGVMGSSAGCYISSLAAVYADPKPKALYLQWGMGNAFLLQDAEKATWLKKHTELPSFLQKNNLSDNLLAQLLKEGTYLDMLTGQQGLADKLRPLKPMDRYTAMPQDLRCLIPAFFMAHYPPTALIHGSKDSLVPVDESVLLAERMRSKSIEVQLEIVEGAEHSLMNPKDPDLARRKLEKMLNFLIHHTMA